ncbi:MAG: hypothetical protein K5863_08740 [Nitratireductor sp.]|uniref:hypothetical protein n=1 Tax=Nitratireductor TaxID=245876 RepID=UPI0026075FCA|nr:MULTISPECIES: hypothetical protein [Nitratireductor]MCV0350149.1 hypothetical protein [Nitratireductor sp.]MDV2965540.1 hypothetical protein [Nitratireductor aquimarinus]
MNEVHQTGAIAVTFAHRQAGYNEKRYHYKCKYPVEVGDHVIVDTPHNGYTCVKVVAVLPAGSANATKSVIQVVNDNEYQADLQREKRIREIKAQLKARQNEIAELAFFRHLAEVDPEAKVLVDELSKLAA